jgi:hypothetical protein
MAAWFGFENLGKVQEKRLFQKTNSGSKKLRLGF